MDVLFASGSADRESVDFQRGDSDADRNALSVFAAGANAFVELQIASYHADSSKHVRAVADQRGVLQRRCDLAVLDHVALGGGEDELAVRDIDLPAAEIDGVHTTFHGTNDVFWRI